MGQEERRLNSGGQSGCRTKTSLDEKGIDLWTRRESISGREGNRSLDESDCGEIGLLTRAT
jgi:hypothetical protein